MINEFVGKDVKPIYDAPRPGDIKHSLADITLAKKTIGFKPTVSFDQGLQKAISWYRDNIL
jgi:UDP-N-acetylglucosamine 4-epimerase